MPISHVMENPLEINGISGVGLAWAKPMLSRQVQLRCRGSPSQCGTSRAERWGGGWSSPFIHHFFWEGGMVYIKVYRCIQHPYYCEYYYNHDESSQLQSFFFQAWSVGICKLALVGTYSDQVGIGHGHCAMIRTVLFIQARASNWHLRPWRWIPDDFSCINNFQKHTYQPANPSGHLAVVVAQ